MFLRLLALLVLLSSQLPPAFAASDEPLDPALAFRFAARALDDKTVEVRYTIAEGYYLYRDKFRFYTDEPARLGTADIPPGKVKDDPNFGRVETLRNTVVIRVPVAQAADGALKLEAQSQGCADLGVCYPPQTHTASLQLAALSSPATGTADGGKALPDALRKAMPGAAADAPAPPAPATAGEGTDETTGIANLLKGSSLWVAVGFFFLAGIGLALTPCMLPMVPILSGIIVGQGAHASRGRTLLLAVTYVLAMALVYAAAGVAAGLSGTMLSAALQNAWVLGAFALVFVVLAFSMFGFYELQMPGFVQNRASDAAGHQQAGSLGGVALMGALSAIIVGPCVAAPLAGALLYIAQTGDAALGGLALFAMALGMGVPLILISLSANALVPKTGAWMEGVKKGFGAILLGLALWIVSPVIPALAHMLGWAALLIFSAIYLHALDPLPPHAHGWMRFWKGVGVVALLVGASLLVGALAGSRDPLQPLGFLRTASAAPEAAHAGAPRFERVKNVAELDARLAGAGRPVMLDFYADWCVSCKEMERFTFTDPKVKARMDGMLLLQADVTANTAEDKALLQRFGLFGPPGIIFFGADGKEIPSLRVVGYQAPEKFLPTLDKAAATAKAANPSA